MDCSTCINRHNPHKNGYCRTMMEKPSEFSCHMTKAEAIRIEKTIKRYWESLYAIHEAESQIKWLEGLAE
jgi:cyclopropane fatty-acyl-phospholipid synthase-like methyltransferase